MDTYFIVGGNGFIGFHIIKQLLKKYENKRIISYDSFKHYISLNKSDWPFYIDYRAKKFEKWGVEQINGDATDKQFLQSKLLEYDPDYIINLAALPIAKIANKKPFDAESNILNSLTTILNTIVVNSLNVRKVIYTSSSMVYGDFKKDDNGNIISAKESQECNPIGVYGSMKLSGEYIIKSYNNIFDIPYLIIRPSAVYGPTDCNRRVTEIFMKNAFLGKDLRLDNGGEHKLDFTYVSDTANGFILATESSIVNETFNITYGIGRKIKEYAQVLQSHFDGLETYNKSINVTRPNRGSLDISKAKNLLNYFPRYPLEYGIKKYINFIKNVKPPYIK